MLLMLIDHVRETVFLHQQVGDPVDVSNTSAALFFTRFTSTFCAPAFIALAGLSAWLYEQKYSRWETSLFLLKRGSFLILLELFIVGPAWTGVFLPEKFYLQVIWCIGLCMIFLAGLIHLPWLGQIVIGIALIAGHHLLDSIVLPRDSAFHFPWAILHQRDWIELAGVPARTSYPVLPWIGVILLGYIIGPWFSAKSDLIERKKRLYVLGISMLSLFLALRWLNIYGDQSWTTQESALRTVMSFLSLTKYPPSLLFLLLTLSISTLVLAKLDQAQPCRLLASIAEFGSAPMFFYLLHLYVLKVIYLILVATYGTNQGSFYGVSHISGVWLWAAVLVYPLYLITCRFARFKQSHRDARILKYF